MPKNKRPKLKKERKSDSSRRDAAENAVVQFPVGGVYFDEAHHKPLRQPDHTWTSSFVIPEQPDKIAVTQEQYEILCWTKNTLRLDAIGISASAFRDAWQARENSGEDYDVAFRNTLLDFVEVQPDPPLFHFFRSLVEFRASIAEHLCVFVRFVEKLDRVLERIE